MGGGGGCRISAIFYKEDNYCNFLLGFSAHNIFCKGVYSKKKEFAPFGKNSFLLEKTLQKGYKTVLSVLHPLKKFQFL